MNDGIKFSIAHNFDNFRLEFAFDEMHFCSCSAVGYFVNCWFDWINEHLIQIDCQNRLARFVFVTAAINSAPLCINKYKQK